MTRVPESEMFFSGEPTSDFDNAGDYLRVYYETHCPELNLGGWKEKIKRRVRYILFGYQDYVLDRDRHSFMLGLIQETSRIEQERIRQISLIRNL